MLRHLQVFTVHTVSMTDLLVLATSGPLLPLYLNDRIESSVALEDEDIEARRGSLPRSWVKPGGILP